MGPVRYSVVWCSVWSDRESVFYIFRRKVWDHL